MLPTLALAFTLHVTPAVADLAGEWRYTSTRGTTYWDTSSNAYLGHGGGMSDTFVFAKDGTYKEYAYIENSPSAGWTTKIFTTMDGRYEVVGDSLKLTVLKGRYKTEDNRVARYNIDRLMTKEEAKKRQRAYRFTLTTGDKPAMVFDLGGEKMTYPRVR